MMTFFQRHPKIHALLHWLMAVVGFVVSTQDKILAATGLVPAGSKIPRFVGYMLATAAFSKILLGRAATAGGETAPIPAAEDALASMIPSTDNAAPKTVVSASEAITKDETPKV
jgi:hypothetical protein